MAQLFIKGFYYDVPDEVHDYVVWLWDDRIHWKKQATAYKNAILQYSVKAITFRLKPTNGTREQLQKSYTYMVDLATGVKQGELFENNA